jgi:beta-glucanase (GH16 family)
VRSGDGWQSDLVDAFSAFRQTYGYFEARIRIPEGRGLWPAFWLAQDWAASFEEFDIMEVCANPPGTNDGNDVTVLHQIIHAPGVDRSGSKALQARVPLSNDWHTYGLDWRPDHVDFYVDGVRTFHYGNAAAIPNVPMTPILSLGLGSWCGRPDATTPSPSLMQVDWVRVRK